MNDQIIETTRGDLTLSTDRSRINVAGVHALLCTSHWGQSMTREMVQRAIENSVNVGVYDASNRQLAFARAVTDLATYAYLTDVIVAEDARGRGIGSWMVDAFLAHPDLQGLRRISLWTRNARRLYEKHGFSTDLPAASTYMEIRPGPNSARAPG
jgi:ribosomal protein S18 acetylase RimI-like enzyme